MCFNNTLQKKGTKKYLQRRFCETRRQFDKNKITQIAKKMRQTGQTGLTRMTELTKNDRTNKE